MAPSALTVWLVPMQRSPPLPLRSAQAGFDAGRLSPEPRNDTFHEEPLDSQSTVQRTTCAAERVQPFEVNCADYVVHLSGRVPRPAEMPVELVTRYDLIVNRGAADQLGLTLSPSFSAQVDEWIE